MRNNIFIIIILTILIVGSSLTLFVYKMSCTPSHHKSVLMERSMIFENMKLWMNQTLLVLTFTIILAGVILTIFYILNRNK